MKCLTDYLRLFAEISPFVGSLTPVRKGIRKALSLFANEFQLQDGAEDSVSHAIRENMRVAVVSIGILTTGLRTLADYNCFLAGEKEVPAHIFDALVKHHTLCKQLGPNYPSELDEYCGQMVWRVADKLMADSLNDMCSAAMADKKEEV